MFVCKQIVAHFQFVVQFKSKSDCLMMMMMMSQ